MSTKNVKAGLSKANVNAIAGAIGTATLNRLVPIFSTSVAYEKGQYTNYNNQLYRFTADKAAGAWDSSKVESASLNNLIHDVNEAVATINNKANVDGNYPTLTAGNADQLNSTVYVLDKVPYLYRTSGGDADIGNREYDKIIGGSLAVNQSFKVRNTTLVENGITITTNPSDNSFTVNGTSTQTDSAAYMTLSSIDLPIGYFKAGHKYLVLGISDLLAKATNISPDSALHIPAGGSTTSPYTGTLKNDDIIACSVSSSTATRFYLLTHVGDSWNNYKAHIDFIDLTQMLGSIIADYIYSLEQANAGAGVAWFRNYFKELYYPHNEGAIKNVKLISHDMVGFNQWDEEAELGGIDSSTGANESSSTNIRSKNYIRVIPNTTYYFKCTGNDYVGGRFYDKDKNFIESKVVYMNNTFTVPANAYYMRFVLRSTYGTTYNNDICINLSWSGWRNGQYEPYQKNSYPLDTTIELRGIPKLDSNNHLYFDGDEYSSDGKVVRKYGVVDLGTLSWSKIQWGTGEVFQATLNGVALKDTCLLCSKYSVVAQNSMYNNPQDKTITNNYGFSWNIKIVDSAYTTAGEFAAAMSGVYLVYELATPTEENAAPFQEPQIVDDFGTEEYVVPTQDGWQVPVGHDTKYPANLRDKLQRLPDMPSVSQNVTETYVVNYNGATKKCTFVDIAGWLGANGWIKLTDITGYDATKTQTLKNVNGTLTWVDD